MFKTLVFLCALILVNSSSLKTKFICNEECRENGGQGRIKNGMEYYTCDKCCLHDVWAKAGCEGARPGYTGMIIRGFSSFANNWFYLEQIMAVNDEKCLELEDPKASEGSGLLTKTCDKSKKTQLFRLDAKSGLNAPTWWTIRETITGKCVVPGNNSRVILKKMADCPKWTQFMEWNYVSFLRGFSLKIDNQCLDNGSPKVYSWNCSYGTNERWRTIESESAAFDF